MKIETENLKERVATEELVRDLVRNDARRGEYMIMMDDADEERFVQIACDYEDIGGKSDGRFDLEYQDGTDGNLYHCKRRVGADEVECIFLDELAGRGAWRDDFPWERMNVSGGAGLSAPGFNDMPMWGRVLFGTGVVLGIAAIGAKLYRSVRAALLPESSSGRWVEAAFFAVMAIALFGPLPLKLLKWLKTRGTKRMARERMIPVEGIRLKRKLPNGLLFMAFWCVFWNVLVTKGRMVGTFGNGPVIGIIHQLIGTGLTAYFIWLLWKHLCPSYEVRLPGGMLKEGERATFEYRFRGNAEKVERVTFATAACAAGNERNGSVGASPGDVNDAKALTNPLEIASGNVSLELPRIAEACHADFKNYFRATVVFKSGLTVVSSYRIPLK